MASPRAQRPNSVAALAAYLAVCGVGGMFTLSSTGCSRDAEASETDAAPAAVPDQVVSDRDGGLPSLEIDEEARDPRPSIAPMIERVSGAVVGIRALDKPIEGAGLFGSGRGEGKGSGFIVDADATVVTNHHVIDGASRVEVRLADGRTFRADVLGSDPATDIAVLRLRDADGLPNVELGASADLRIGDWVVAIGNPLGLEHSASVGIVSGRGRGSLGLYRDSYLDFLQTDADIAPGSSGGPLFDLAGRVVGIATAVTGHGGAGFAIPIDQARDIIPQLRDRGVVVRGWLGASGSSDTEDAGGARIQSVYAHTPADEAGLRPGDVVVDVDGERITSFDALRSAIARKQPGHTAQMGIERDGRVLELAVVLAERPAGDHLDRLRTKRRFLDRPPARSTPRSEAGPHLSPDLSPRLGITAREHARGLEVVSVAPGSLAEDLGLQPGDVLLAIGGAPIRAPKDVSEAVGKATDTLEIELLRGTSRQRVVLHRS